MQHVSTTASGICTGAVMVGSDMVLSWFVRWESRPRPAFMRRYGAASREGWVIAGREDRGHGRENAVTTHGPERPGRMRHRAADD